MPIIIWQTLEATVTIVAACLILLKPLFVRLFPDLVERHARRQHAAGDNIHYGLIASPGQQTHAIDGASTHGLVVTDKKLPASGTQENAGDCASNLEGLEFPIRNVHLKEPRAIHP